MVLPILCSTQSESWMNCVSPIATLAAAASPAAELPAWIWVLITIAASIACVTDLRATRIPNWLTLPLLAAGLAYWTVLDGWSGLGFSSAGMGVAGLVFIIGYAMFGGGAGDAKLMMAFGAWIGPEASKILMLTVTGAGFVQAISVTIYRGGLWDVPYLLMHSVTTSRNAVRRAFHGKFGDPSQSEEDVAKSRTTVRARPKGWVPYAPAILAGTIVAWWYWVKYGPIGGIR